MSKEKVLEALGEWIVHVCEAKEMATPAEIAALPEIAKVFLDAIVLLPENPCLKGNQIPLE